MALIIGISLWWFIGFLIELYIFHQSEEEPYYPVLVIFAFMGPLLFVANLFGRFCGFGSDEEQE